jgi:hypothetical protein
MAYTPRRIFAATLASAALFGAASALPAGAQQPAVRAHIALGCNPGSHRHHRHSHMTGGRCQSVLRGHVVLAHAA